MCIDLSAKENAVNIQRSKELGMEDQVFPFFFLEKKENTVNIQRGQELGMEGTSFFCLGFFSDCGLQMAKP